MNQYGIEVLLTNGEVEHYDPCESDPMIVGNDLVVANIYCDYSHPLSEVVKWDRYDLCPVCLFDVRSYNCSEACDNPRQHL